MIDLLVLSIFPAALVLAAASDLFSMTISNKISIGFALAFLAVALYAGIEPYAILMHLSAGFAMLVLGFGLFAMGWIGGGDAKLFASTAIWIGWAHLLEYALWSSVIGGVLTLAMLMARAMPLPSALEGAGWVTRLHNAGHGVPYGIALAAAGLVVYPATEWFALILR